MFLVRVCYADLMFPIPLHVKRRCFLGAWGLVFPLTLLRCGRISLQDMELDLVLEVVLPAFGRSLLMLVGAPSQ